MTARTHSWTDRLHWHPALHEIRPSSPSLRIFTVRGFSMLTGLKASKGGLKSAVYLISIHPRTDGAGRRGSPLCSWDNGNQRAAAPKNIGDKTAQRRINILRFNSLFCFFTSTSRTRNRTSRQSGWHSCFVFGRSRVQIRAQRPAVLTEVFVGFLSPSRQIMA